MAPVSFVPPSPRSTLADPALWRPDQYDTELRPDDVLWLDRGECIDPEMTALAMDILRGLPDHALFAYPVPGPLYRRLARHLAMEPDRLLLTQGSDGGIKAVYETFIEPGDKVLFTNPTYQMYGVYAQVYGAEITHVPYRLVDGRPFLTAAEIVSAIEAVRPKLVGLPNPDNPTGFVFSDAELRSIVEAAGEAGALMLVDEAYYPFHDGTAVPMVEEYGHLVVARTFSKAWGMAGIRLGYLVARPEVIDLVRKPRFMVEGTGLGMAMAERMLDHEAEVAASLARLKEGRRMFAEAMTGLGHFAVETPCNFVHVNFGDRRAAVEEVLKDVARYRLFPGGILHDFLRFTTTTPELFRRVIDAIASVGRG